MLFYEYFMNIFLNIYKIFMEYMKHLTLKKRRTRTKGMRTKGKRTKNNMKRRNSCKRRVTKGVMKGG